MRPIGEHNFQRPYRLPYLETQVTYGCTLSCLGCTNYSDYPMSGGNVAWEDFRPQFEQLVSRIQVESFGFIGGEPFLHNDFQNWVVQFKEKFPYITLMIVSNATLLSKNWWILDVMEEYGMIYLKLSDHTPGSTYFKDAVDKIMSRFHWVEENMRWFNQEHILDFETVTSDVFLKTYKNTFNDMKPYDSNPADAFKICNQTKCPLFQEGKLYKCSSVGMLDRVLEDHNLHDDPDWQPYVNTGLDVYTATDLEISNFCNNYEKPHSLCRMCPTAKDRPYIKHYSTVVNKINIL